MTALRPDARAVGWTMAGVAATALLCGAAAVALAAERQAPALVLDLGALPPAAPAVTAVAEAAPRVREAAPLAPTEPEMPEAAPDLPLADPAPKLAAAAPLAQPVPDLPVHADLTLPPPEKQAPEVKKAPERTKPKPKPDHKTVKQQAEERTKVTETTEAKPVVKKEMSAPAPTASASKAGAKVKGGAISPAAYAKAVLKQVRAVKKKSGAGKGVVVVGFSIGKDGSLAGVQVLQSSGNDNLDAMALDHIRRSAPFPAPPEDAGRSYSFEFVGK